MRPIRAWLPLLALAALSGCTGERSPKSDLVAPLLIRGASPGEILPGTLVTVELDGVLEAGVAEYRFMLLDGGGAVLDQGQADRLDSGHLGFTPGQGFVLARLGTQASLVLQIARRISLDGSLDSAQAPFSWRVADNLDPVLVTLEPAQAHLSDPLVLKGGGFLQPGEGTTLARLDGAFTFAAVPGVRAIHDLAVPLDVQSRGRAELLLTVDLVGVRPGVFNGNVRLENQTPAGTRTGDAFPAQATVLGPEVTALQPAMARRGQVLTVSGHGFVPTDYALEATTLVGLDGTFTRRDGSTSEWRDATRVLLVPDDFPAPGLLTHVLRVTADTKGRPAGLAAMPGVFQGRVVPILLNGLDWVEGAPAQVTLTIGSPRQVVLLKYLPGFLDALSQFGLEAREAQVRAAILARATQDYQGVNIGFVEERPTDYAEYSVIEIGGRDPNGAGLLGLDNTEGKDVGNLRFNDVLGGLNAASEEAGYYAYGGVFVESFLHFSPSLPGNPTPDMASPRFDDVFGPFSPLLGGEPALAEGDDAQRAAAVAEAVRVLGNLVGNTVTHEIGHSLGLAAGTTDFHDEGDNEDSIMDAGPFRPFAERAILDGQGPEVFLPVDREYLLQILPLDEPR
jgi:hypothetical protein